MQCFAVLVTVDLKPRPRWITCSLDQNAARRGFHPSGVQSPFYYALFLSTILVVSELWSTTGGFCGGDCDGAASVRCLLPSTVHRDFATSAMSHELLDLALHAACCWMRE